MNKIVVQKNNNQRGAVSLFIVIFVTLLISIVAVGFIRIMIQDQQQASTVDLSKSAFDSAQAGVEDAKRALLKYQKACASGSPVCATLRSTFDAQTCDTLVDAGVVSKQPGDQEVKIQQTSGDISLDQAYTCVKVNTKTDNYLANITAGQSKLIPLVGASPFNQIVVRWYTQDNNGGQPAITQPATAADLPQPSAWPTNRPSLVRSQLIQYQTSGFNLADLSTSGSRTLFMSPTSSGINNFDFSYDARDNSGGTSKKDVRGVRCQSFTLSTTYACEATYSTLGVIDPATQTAYLRLGVMYNDSNISIELRNNGTPVKFNGVQFLVDATGRANDVFRRVENRVELEDVTPPYPDFAVDVNGDVCKDFAVTDDPTTFPSSNQCAASWAP